MSFTLMQTRCYIHRNNCEQNPNYKPFNIYTRIIASRTGVGRVKVTCFAFMLPCIVIDFFLNNREDILVTQIYCYKTLHVSGIFSAHHQEFSIVPSALVSIIKNLHETYQCRNYSRKLLMMRREDARNI